MEYEALLRTMERKVGSLMALLVLRKISEPSQVLSLDVTVRSPEDWSHLDQHTGWSIEPDKKRTRTSLVVLPFRYIRQKVMPGYLKERVHLRGLL
jgi:hypothetical protein